MNKVVLKSPAEIEIMRKGGAIIAKIVRELGEMVAIDLPTIEFDRKAAALCNQYNVTSGTLGYHGYPASVCISVNEELVHGIPRADKLLQLGDLVKIDMVIIYQDYYLDHAVTLPVGKISDEDQKLLKITDLATNEAVKSSKLGKTIGDLSFTMQSVVELAGFNVTRQMSGHGIGKSMHEGPEILCFGERHSGLKLLPGMVLAIETMAMAGDYMLDIDAVDHWTARTSDGSRTAHFEHTVAVTNGEPLILTKE